MGGRALTRDPKEIVARGYDAIALRYAEWAGRVQSPALEWLRELDARLPDAANVLELGCGRGVPGTRELARRHRVIGVDISAVQIELARHHVPEASFVHADAVEVDIAAASLDAVVALYFFGHVPQHEQRDLVHRIVGWLRDGGLLLATFGAGERGEEIDEDWLGAPMYFASLGGDSYLPLLRESGLEELELKRKVFAELDRVTRAEAVLATNTSALSVSEIAEATTHPERVVGLHFFNPAPVLPLVEVVRARLSSADAVEAAYAWAERAGKQPVRCNDTPGFIVNRILIPLLNDCVRVLDEADVRPEDMDKAMTNGAGWPMGPCALIDLIGVDVHVHASEALHDKLGEARMAPPERLLRMQADGKLGRKSGEGFYTY